MTIKQHSNCTVMRRQLVGRHVMNPTTGQLVEGPKEWMTRQCSTPLFTDTERTTGRCNSCASGWTNPNNHPVGEEPAP